MGEVSEVVVAACVGLREPARQLLHDYRIGLAQIVGKQRVLIWILSQKAGPSRAINRANPVKSENHLPRVLLVRRALGRQQTYQWMR
jgi:hypothetical protein